MYQLVELTESGSWIPTGDVFETRAELEECIYGIVGEDVVYDGLEVE